MKGNTMKKINLLIVMALATQGSSLAAKGKLDDGYQSDIDGANIRNKRKDIDGANIRNKRKSNSPLLKKYAEDNSAKDAAPQIAHIIETADSEMENAPKFRLTGIMSRLWQNKAVRIVVLAAAVSGTVYLLAHYGISQETADQMRDFVKTLPQVTQDQLKSLGNSMSSSGSTVVNFITDAIGNTASALSHYGNASVEAARGLAYGLKDSANAAVGNTASALSRYSNDGVEAARGLAYGLKDAASAVVGNTASNLSAVSQGVKGMGSQVLNWGKENANPIIESVKGMGSQGLSYANDRAEALKGLAYGWKDTVSAVVGNTANALSPYANAAAEAAKSRAPDVAKVGSGVIMGRLSNLKNWWSGERNPQLEEAELEGRREDLLRNPLH